MAVYFAQPIGGGPIKIGHATVVHARIAQLEEHYCQPLALLATMPGGRAEEKEIHQKFHHLRFGQTEQFRPDPDLIAFMRRPLFASATPVGGAMPANFRTVGIRSSAEWADWIERLAKHNRTDVAKVLDAAASQYAKSTGFDEPPPERIP